MSSNWISYNELAWTEDFLADQSDYEKEVKKYVRLIKSLAKNKVNTMLHLGCGAGGHDRYFKKYFKVTGVDLSLGMLAKAKTNNPEIEYLEGDMRTIKLNRQFDCVVIPDSIDYMSSLDDLGLALQNAAIHLKKGGIFLVVAKTKEIFRDNNFVYTGKKGDLEVTLFENNYINLYSDSTYEITMIYLIRKKGKLKTYMENTLAGLFTEIQWANLFENYGFNMQKKRLDGLYDDYIMNDGIYPLIIFIGNKE